MHVQRQHINIYKKGYDSQHDNQSPTILILISLTIKQIIKYYNKKKR